MIRSKESISHIVKTLNNKRSTLPLPLNIYIQPIFDLSYFKIIGGEVLVRGIFQDDIVPPNLFLDQIENTYGITALGYFVIKETFYYMSRNAISGMIICINLSVGQLMAIDFSQTVIALSKSMKIEPKDIIFEITPFEADKFDDCVAQNISQLIEEGFQLAWDDIISLEQLRAAITIKPLDYIKLKVGRVTDEKIIEIKSIIDEAHKNGFKVIAEEVETMREVSVLLKENIRIGQGYIFSRALEKMEFKRNYLNS